jgi:hypothetical protein
MCRLLTILLTVTSIASGGPAVAQVIPLPSPPMIPQLNPIPAPLPPPQQPPIINGPLSQSPPPEVYQPPQLNTFSDRVTQCLQRGGSGGLGGSELDAYTSACANEN